MNNAIDQCFIDALNLHTSLMNTLVLNRTTVDTTIRTEDITGEGVRKIRDIQKELNNAFNKIDAYYLSIDKELAKYNGLPYIDTDIAERLSSVKQDYKRISHARRVNRDDRKLVMRVLIELRRKGDK